MKNKTRAEIRDSLAEKHLENYPDVFDRKYNREDILNDFKAGFDAADAISVPKEEFEKVNELNNKLLDKLANKHVFVYRENAKLQESCAKLVSALNQECCCTGDTDWNEGNPKLILCDACETIAEYYKAWPEEKK